MYLMEMNRTIQKPHRNFLLFHLMTWTLREEKRTVKKKTGVLIR